MKLATIVVMIVMGASLVAAIQMGKPEVRGVKSEWGSIDESITEIITEVYVYNPYPVSLPIRDIHTEIYMNGIKMGEGSALGVEIAPHAESAIVMSTKIKNSLVPKWWVSHIMNGEKSVVVVKGDIVFDFWVAEWEYPVEMSYPVTTDILSGLNLKQAQYTCIKMENFGLKWGVVTEKYTEMRASATVSNNCMYPITFRDVRYSIEVNGVELGEGVSKIETTLHPNSKRIVTFEMMINNQMLEKWWVQHVKNGEVSRGKVTIQPLIEVADRSFRITIERNFDFTTNLLSESG